MASEIRYLPQSMQLHFSLGEKAYNKVAPWPPPQPSIWQTLAVQLLPDGLRGPLCFETSAQPSHRLFPEVLGLISRENSRTDQTRRLSPQKSSLKVSTLEVWEQAGSGESCIHRLGFCVSLIAVNQGVEYLSLGGGHFLGAVF